MAIDRSVRFVPREEWHLPPCCRACGRKRLKGNAIAITRDSYSTMAICIPCVRRMAEVAKEIQPVPPVTAAQQRARKRLVEKSGVKVSKKEAERIRRSWGAERQIPLFVDEKRRA